MVESALQVPPSFFCSLSKTICVDPVVMSDGKSYERAAIESNFPIEQLYPNRALKAIIQESIIFPPSPQNPFMASFKTFLFGDEINNFCNDENYADGDDGDKNKNERFRDFDYESNEDFSNVQAVESPMYQPPPTFPKEFYCPITADLMKEPVIDPDGITYDKEPLLEWLQREGISPVTRKPLLKSQVFPNRAVAEFLKLEKSRSERSMLPMVCEWKRGEMSFRRRLGSVQKTDINGSTDGITDGSILIPVDREEFRSACCYIFVILTVIFLISFFLSVTDESPN